MDALSMDPRQSWGYLMKFMVISLRPRWGLGYSRRSSKVTKVA